MVLDTSKYEELLKNAGFTVHSGAIDFLKKYGGLRIHYPHAKVANMDDEMHFDPLIIVTHVRAVDVKAYGGVVGKELCPIGEAARGYLVLMMAEDGEGYASYDNTFFRAGTSGSDAIEAFCSGREMESIPLEHGWENATD